MKLGLAASGGAAIDNALVLGFGVYGGPLNTPVPTEPKVDLQMRNFHQAQALHKLLPYY